jgi:Putative zinc-finger
MVRCEHAFEEDLAARYLAGDLPEPERDAFEIHLLECGDCARAVGVLAELPAALRETAPLLNEGPVRRTAWLHAPHLAALAATLAVGLAAGILLGRRKASPGGEVPSEVMRGAAPVSDALPIAVVLDLEPGTTGRARRVVTLISCPLPPLGVAERLEASLVGPSRQVAWSTNDAEPISGRVRVAVDLAELEPGAWTLRLRSVDLMAREQSASACAFELP